MLCLIYFSIADQAQDSMDIVAIIEKLEADLRAKAFQQIENANNENIDEIGKQKKKTSNIKR